MPQIAIQLTAGQLAPNPCYTSEQARFTAYVQAIQSSLPLNFTTVIVSTTAPAPDDRDKVWISVDGSGRILGTFLFSNGTWQTIFPTNPYIVPGEIRMYDPAFYTPAQTALEPWMPMDGTVTGVANYQGYFIVGAGQRTLTAAQIAAGETATVFIQGTPQGAEQNIIPLTALPIHSHTPLGGIGNFCVDYGTTPPPSGALSGSGNLVSEQPTTATAGGIYNALTGITTPGTFACLPPSQPTHFMQWRPDLF
jgi:hypothetical protein